MENHCQWVLASGHISLLWPSRVPSSRRSQHLMLAFHKRVCKKTMTHCQNERWNTRLLYILSSLKSYTDLAWNYDWSRMRSSWAWQSSRLECRSGSRRTRCSAQTGTRLLTASMLLKQRRTKRHINTFCPVSDRVVHKIWEVFGLFFLCDLAKAV